MSQTPSLEELAALAGVAATYEDAWGHMRTTPPETIRAILAALGLEIGSEDAIRQEIRRLRNRPRSRPVEPAYVVRDVDGTIAIPVTVRDDELDKTWHWRFTSEDGAVDSGTFEPNKLAYKDEIRDEEKVFQRRWLPLPHMSPGYHALVVTGPTPSRPKPFSAKIICVPREAYWPPEFESGGRIWGFAVQLYALRSHRNWGIGDFTDLRALVHHAGKAGADVIGINPLHATFWNVPSQCGPYAASSRLFINPLYLDIEALPDFLSCPEATVLVASEDFQRRLDRLRAAKLVDYAGVTAAKRAVLELMFRRFVDIHLGPPDLAPLTPRGAAFLDYVGHGGEALRRFAVFEAVSESLEADYENPAEWQRWPQAFRDPESPEVASFEKEMAHRVRFFQYLQWLAEDQLADVDEYCGVAGLGLRLYGDLALGTLAGSADTWSEQRAYVSMMSMGAPPDAFNQKGQDWALPPMDPGVLTETGFEPFIRVLQASMRYAGALRIDHVLGLARLFWVPSGTAPDQGGYVRYPLDALIGLIALESQRNRCLIIGEDLGTVSPELRGKLQAANILSYRVLMFETDGGGRFHPPEAYPDRALVTVTTHDLPTLRGFWENHDLSVRAELDLFTSQEARAHAHEERRQAQAELTAALIEEGLLDVGGQALPSYGPELVRAVHRFMARTRSHVQIVNFEDLIGELDQTNVPGTVDQHPNWKRKLSVSVDDLFADRQVLDVIQALNVERGRSTPS